LAPTVAGNGGDANDGQMELMQACGLMERVGGGRVLCGVWQPALVILSPIISNKKVWAHCTKTENTPRQPKEIAR